MAKYNRVKIGDVHLTHDRLVGGVRCKLEVDGLAALRPGWTGYVRKPMSGKPRRFRIANTGEGLDVIVRPTVIDKATLDDLLAIFDASNAAADTFNVTVEGDTGDFDLECVQLLPQQIFFPDRFRHERIYGVQIHMTVDAVNSIG